MLVATRDPVPQHARHDAAAAPGVPHSGSHASRLMFVLQLAGSLLAIPVGLASGYSIYRANFSPETTCQALRSSIVSMIDKQIDASTRRMLVRKDVETFEKTCGSVDPDAGAAFKSLLASETPPVLRPATEALDMPAHEWRKTEPAAKSVKETKAKEPKEPKEARVEPHAEAHAEPHADAPSSDARWLNAVRHALTAHEAERAAQDATVKPLVVPASADAMVAPIQIAPALPPPSSVAGRSAARPRAEDHPVPPGAIPDVVPEPATTSAVRPQTSWLDHLPLIGR